MMGWAGDVGWAGWTVMAVCMLAFWAVVTYLVATLFRVYRGSVSTADSDPLQLLKSRYARGDIDSHEFVARRQVLTQTLGATEDSGRQGGIRG